MLKVVRGLREELGPDAVLVMTVFNPMSVALELAGGASPLGAAIADDPTAVHRGLRAITDTFCDFASLAIEQGADGLFLATTHAATRQSFTIEQVEEFGRPYDLEVLDAAAAGWFHALHVCKGEAYVRELADYPVQALNWDSLEATNPGLGELGGAAGGKALIGGLDRELFAVPGAAGRLVEQVRAARADAGDAPLIIGSTCTIPTESLEENIRAVCAAVREG
jgi:uroporphyrinogen decarboxylase